jgi:hypothetical protein
MAIFSPANTLGAQPIYAPLIERTYVTDLSVAANGNADFPHDFKRVISPNSSFSGGSIGRAPTFFAYVLSTGCQWRIPIFPANPNRPWRNMALADPGVTAQLECLLDDVGGGCLKRRDEDSTNLQGTVRRAYDAAEWMPDRHRKSASWAPIENTMAVHLRRRNTECVKQGVVERLGFFQSLVPIIICENIAFPRFPTSGGLQLMPKTHLAVVQIDPRWLRFFSA